MILSDKDIRAKLSSKEIVITSANDDHLDNLNSASLDLRLSKHFLVYRAREQKIIDPKDKENFKNAAELITVNDPEEGLVLQAGEFIVGSTEERIKLAEHMLAKLVNRSSLERLGISIDSGGIIEPGFEGTISLSIKNNNKIPVVLYPGMRICQLCFESLSSKADQPYYSQTDNKYQGQELPIRSKLDQELR